MPFLVGLVGGIAAGKSTATAWLSKRGAIVIDADKVGHQLYADANSVCFKDLVGHFGKSIVNGDGTIDRRALGSIVFGSADQMKALQSIVWPCIAIRLQELVEQEDDASVVVVEAAILLEAGWDAVLPFDHLIGVHVDPVLALSRLMARNGLSEEEADKRIGSQMGNEERAARVDSIIDNGGSEEELASRLEDVWREIESKKGKKAT